MWLVFFGYKLHVYVTFATFVMYHFQLLHMIVFITRARKAATPNFSFNIKESQGKSYFNTTQWHNEEQEHHLAHG